MRQRVVQLTVLQWERRQSRAAHTWLRNKWSFAQSSTWSICEVSLPVVAFALLHLLDLNAAQRSWEASLLVTLVVSLWESLEQQKLEASRLLLGWWWSRGWEWAELAAWSPSLVWGRRCARLGVMPVLSWTLSFRWLLSWPKPFISYKYSGMKWFVVKVLVSIDSLMTLFYFW